MRKYNIGDKVLFDLNSGSLRVKPIFVDATITDVSERPYDFKDVFGNHVKGNNYFYTFEYELDGKTHTQKILEYYLNNNEDEYWTKKAKAELPEIEEEVKSIETELQEKKKEIEFLKKYWKD